MLVPILAGLGALYLSNPPKRKRRNSRTKKAWYVASCGNKPGFKVHARTPDEVKQIGAKHFKAQPDEVGVMLAKDVMARRIDRISGGLGEWYRVEDHRARRAAEAEAQAMEDHYEYVPSAKAAALISAWNDDQQKRFRAKRRENPRAQKAKRKTLDLSVGSWTNRKTGSAFTGLVVGTIHPWAAKDSRFGVGKHLFHVTAVDPTMKLTKLYYLVNKLLRAAKTNAGFISQMKKDKRLRVVPASSSIPRTGILAV